MKVLVTDYAWPDLEIEKTILTAAGIELVDATTQDTSSLVPLVADVDGILTCWASVPKSVIEATRQCQIIARMGIGLDNIDIQSCTDHKIIVTNVPDYCSHEVAEHTLAPLRRTNHHRTRPHIAPVRNSLHRQYTRTRAQKSSLAQRRSTRQVAVTTDRSPAADLHIVPHTTVAVNCGKISQANICRQRHTGAQNYADTKLHPSTQNRRRMHQLDEFRTRSQKTLAHRTQLRTKDKA